MKKQYIHSILAVLLMAVIAYFFFYPNAQEGQVLQQHDILQGLANGQEAKEFHEQTGETTRWTNSLFGGMPTFQISPSYPSSNLTSWIMTVYSLGLPSPCNLLFIMMLGFFIMALCMKMRTSVALLGALAWGFSTYFIIIIGAGHIWKFVTLAYIPPTIGGILLCYRGRYIAGTALAALFGALQLQANHPQMSYYFLFLILFMVIAFAWNAFKEKQWKNWGIATACIVIAGTLATFANAPSLYLSYNYSKETIRGKKTELDVSKTIIENSGQRLVEKSITSTDGDKIVLGYEPYKGEIDPRQEKFDYITQWSYGKGETFSLLIPNIKGGASIKPVKGENYPKYALGNDFVVQNTFQQLIQPVMERLYYQGELDENGNPLTQNAYDVLNSTFETAQSIVSATEYFGDQPMTNGPVYVGAFILVLAVLAMFVVDSKPYNTVKWALFAATLLSILLAWGHNLGWFTHLFIDYFPGYGTFRTVSSILVIAEFTIPMLAMLCIHKILTTDDFLKRYKTKCLGVAGGAVAICLIVWLAPSIFGQPFAESDLSYLNAIGAFENSTFAGTLQTIADNRLDLVASDALRSLIFIILGCAVIIAYLKFRNKLSLSTANYMLGAGLIALTLLDLYPVNKRYIDTENFVEADNDVEAFVPTDADKEILADKSIFYRVLDFDDFSGARSSYFHKTIGGYHAAKLTRYNDIIDAQLLGNKMNPNVINMLNAKYKILNGAVEFNPDALGNAWFVDSVKFVDNNNDEMIALNSINPATTAVANRQFSYLPASKPTSEGDGIRLIDYAPNELTYSAKSRNGGVAVFSEVYFPWGWTAEIDGNPTEIARVNYLLRAVNVPAGEHKITFRFDPQSVHTTDTLATISIIMIYLLCAGALTILVINLMKRGKNQPESKEKKADK